MEAFLYSRVFGVPAPNSVPETRKSHTERQLIQRRLQYISMVRIMTSVYVKTRRYLELSWPTSCFPEKASLPVKIGEHDGYVRAGSGNARSRERPDDENTQLGSG